MVITFSEWCKNDIIKRHRVSADKFLVQPIPSALPASVVPRLEEFIPRQMSLPLKLLLVGREYKRKGIPIACEVVRRLNSSGIAAELTICGMDGEPDGPVRFAGSFRKKVIEELRSYAGLYRQSHLLIHPALFEAAGIVPAEASAFGVPTITNDVGGLATSVAHNGSGIVLPWHSPPGAYVAAICELVRNPETYRQLSLGARNRYEKEQNWEVAGRRVMTALEELVARSSH